MNFPVLCKLSFSVRHSFHSPPKRCIVGDFNCCPCRSIVLINRALSIQYYSASLVTHLQGSWTQKWAHRSYASFPAFEDPLGYPYDASDMVDDDMWLLPGRKRREGTMALPELHPSGAFSPRILVTFHLILTL